MSSPEEKERKRKRMKIRSKIAKDLVTNPRYRKKVEPNRKKKVEVKDLTHADLVKLINEKEEDRG